MREESGDVGKNGIRVKINLRGKNRILKRGRKENLIYTSFCLNPWL